VAASGAGGAVYSGQPVRAQVSGASYHGRVSGLLRPVWDEPRAPDAPRRVWRDWVLVAVLPVLAVVEGIVRQDMSWRVVSVAVTVALVPTLLWRRTRPLLMFLIAAGVTVVAPLLIGRDSISNTSAYQLILIYALVRWGSGREALAGLAVVLAKLGLSLSLGDLTPGDVSGGLLIVLATAALGAAFRYRARARQRELDQARLLESERLARDLHDTVAHHVSAIAIRAQAGLAVVATQPHAAADALRLIEAEAGQALAEMRAIVRVLRRDEPAQLAPSPRIDDLVRLAGRTRAGPLVTVRLDGDLDGVSPPVGTAIYRLAQESVTNALRHARHATRVEVRVTADDTSVRLRVSDDGDTGAVRPGAAPGYGLVGMAERAGLLGGVCEAGPGPGRGWTVTAVLPRNGAPA
jgi:signal transduction histidine kinase